MEKSKLIVSKSGGKKSFRMKYITKKGKETETAVRTSAMYFNSNDAEDGAEIEYELGPDGQPAKVVLVGFPEVQPGSASQVTRGNTTNRGQANREQAQRGHGNSGNRPYMQAPQAVSQRTMDKAPASALGLPFHNPYTFIPFAQGKRGEPTLRTADELSSEDRKPVRYTGVLFLQVTNKRPLMTLFPEADRVIEVGGSKHGSYRALIIGNDVIVPATGIKGALRSLLTVITGGTLGYIDQRAYLCQARDLALEVPNYPEPAQKDGYCVLARVIEAGNSSRPGIVEVGTTELVLLTDLERLIPRIERGNKGRPIFVALGLRGPKSCEILKVGQKCDADTPFEIKLSGRPINLRGKREGAFRGSGEQVSLSIKKWADFYERYKHGPNAEPKAGELIWLEVKSPNGRVVNDSDVISIQAARWGRRGESLVDAVRKHAPHAIPDYLKDDGQVDEVTNLFGQVNVDGGENVCAFQARLRPDNLVFEDCMNRVIPETLAPLAPPHPGCVAFYRSNSNSDDISREDPLRGFKVYRVGDATDAPWKFSEQPITGDDGRPKQAMQSVNKTVELLQVGSLGKCQIAFRSLSKRELALLLMACSVPWRLGGGKPLGLGLCRVCVKDLVDEFGRSLEIEGWTTTRAADDCLLIDGWETEVADLKPRMEIWRATQQPVAKLRYPRAGERNGNKVNRGGHVWFPRHAAPNQAKQRGEIPRGLRPMRIGGQLQQAVNAPDRSRPMVAAQPLPNFNSKQPLGDLLYGFDGFTVRQGQGGGSVNTIENLEAFNPQTHITGNERSGGNTSENAQTRDQRKKQR